MKVVTLDLETYFDKDYTLKKMATSLYIKDPRFKVHTLGYKIDDGPTGVLTTDFEIRTFLAGIHWNKTAIVCHHTQFDGLALAHHYGVVPAFYYDTLSMFRALYGQRSRADLDSALAYTIGLHKTDDVEFIKGKLELTPEELQRLVEYNKGDVEGTYQMFLYLLAKFPKDELSLIDLTVRMFTQPGFEIDVPRAEAEHTKEVGHKAGLMLLAGLTSEILQSGDKFAKWLQGKGVTPPTKISPTTNKLTWAFAKTDHDFTRLLEHENELVRFGVEARLGVKSTGNETRAARFVTEGKLGPLPVYLAYYGAHTGRWSGGNKINLQNLKRGGELRKCLIAPRGYVIGVADSGQIECRVNAWLSGQTSILEQFSRYDAGDAASDPYRIQASKSYSIPVNEVDSVKRFIGKIAVLGLGFQMGGPKYQGTLAAGTMGPKVDISLDEAYSNVKIYRDSNKEIVKMWERCEGILQELWMNKPGAYKCIEWFNDKIWLPNGMYLDYPELAMRIDTATGLGEDKSFQSLDIRKKIYGGLCLENVVQALARIIVAYQMMLISRRYKVLTMTHDEIVCLIPENEADEGWQFMYECMTTPPGWCADLPLKAEGGYAREYSK